MSDKALMANANKGAEKQLERAKRQAILMRIVESSKKNLTFEQIAEKMREDPWIAARWPAYSAATANNDFNTVMALVEDDIRAMAKPYLARNLQLRDEAIEVLRGFAQDEDLDYKTRIDSANALLKYVQDSDKVFGNYAAKEMHIKKAEVTMDLDTYKQLSARAKKQLGNADIIDGDFEE